MPSLFRSKSNFQEKAGFSSPYGRFRSQWKLLAAAVLGFVFFSLFVSNRFHNNHHITVVQKKLIPPLEPATNISHLVFGLIGSVKGWRHRKPYIESWWKPNITRGYMFLDVDPSKDLLPWPNTSPPFRVSENNTKLLKITKHHGTMVRIARGLLETFMEKDKGVRWIVMGDDDSIFFTENMVEMLRKYDHKKYVYIGGHSESAYQNYKHSFDMGFGGAGVIFSYSLAAALVPRLDDCIKRYPFIDAADQMWQACLADMGVYLTPQKGIHQFDFGGDVSGYLSAHPQTPVISLHHPEKLEPYFPKVDRYQSVHQIMKAAKVDQSRLFQQTICHDRVSNWSISVSWGYSTHIYEKIYPKSILQKPLQTFKAWVNTSLPQFIFNTRIPSKNPCETPHIFFFKSINETAGEIHTTYARVKKRGLPACSLTRNHSADSISTIHVFSSMEKLTGENRRECCDVLRVDGENFAEVYYRSCEKDEVVG